MNNTNEITSTSRSVKVSKRQSNARFRLLTVFAVLLCLLFGTKAWADTYTLSSSISANLTAGTHYFYDSGGSSGEYSDGETYTATFTFDGTITINFSQFVTENNSNCNSWDYMYIYDGTSSGTQLAYGVTGCNSATLSTGTNYTATSGMMTITWRSDGSNTAAGWQATITATPPTPPTAPTSVTASPSYVNIGGTTTLTASGGANGNYHWYENCPSVAYINNFYRAPSSTDQTTINSVNNGILRVTSTGGDPMIHLYGVGSFPASAYRYIQIRYRVISGNAGYIQVFYQGTGFGSLDENHSQTFLADNSGNWNLAVMDMLSSYWTSTGDITGFRFDYCGASGVTMEIDYIALVSEQCIGTGASITSPAIDEPTTFNALVIGDGGVTSCQSVDVNISAPIISQSTTPICGEEVLLTASLPGGASVPSGYSYHWYSNSTCTTEITSGVGGTNNNQLTIASSDGGQVWCRLEKAQEQQVTNFEYTGTVKTYTIPNGTTSLTLEVWGAQGGSYNSTYTGGKGGYAVGTLNNPSGTLYVVVGGQGTSVSSSTVGGAGGYNGGGAGGQGSNSSLGIAGSGGGGATHIATTSGLLSTLSSNTSSVLLVAGGGGGASGAATYGSTSSLNESSTACSGGAAGVAGGKASGGTYNGSGGTAGTTSSAGTGGAVTTASSSNADGYYYTSGGGGAGAGYYGGGGGAGGSTSHSSYRGSAGSAGGFGYGGAG